MDLDKVVHPFQTVLVTCREEVPILGRVQQKDNIIAIDWHMPLSFNPPMYCIAIGKTRFSYELVKKSQVFTVNFMPFKLQKEVLLCGTRTGRHIDKFVECGFTKIDGSKIDCPKIKEAIGYLECEVTQEIETGDHVLFIGKIVSQEIKKESKRLLHVGGNEFSTTK